MKTLVSTNTAMVPAIEVLINLFLGALDTQVAGFSRIFQAGSSSSGDNFLTHFNLIAFLKRVIDHQTKYLLKADLYTALNNQRGHKTA